MGDKKHTHSARGAELGKGGSPGEAPPLPLPPAAPLLPLPQGLTLE